MADPVKSGLGKLPVNITSGFACVVLAFVSFDIGNRVAACKDGAVFAAAAFLLVTLLPAILVGLAMWLSLPPRRFLLKAAGRRRK
ncbi:MAG: hypothetical protein JWM87_2066 [Candidatus Eremiobacteraeota bacterium]|nr:hypothetical protein [Candidatus Eremiobacteraeota bacterium]